MSIKAGDRVKIISTGLKALVVKYVTDCLPAIILDEKGMSYEVHIHELVKDQTKEDKFMEKKAYPQWVIDRVMDEADLSDFDILVCENCGRYFDAEEKCPHSNKTICKDCCETCADELARDMEIDSKVSQKVVGD